MAEQTLKQQFEATFVDPRNNPGGVTRNPGWFKIENVEGDKVPQVRGFTQDRDEVQSWLDQNQQPSATQAALG